MGAEELCDISGALHTGVRVCQALRLILIGWEVTLKFQCVETQRAPLEGKAGVKYSIVGAGWQNQGQFDFLNSYCI